MQDDQKRARELTNILQNSVYILGKNRNPFILKLLHTEVIFR